MKFHEDDLKYGKYLYATYSDKWAAYIVDDESNSEIHLKLLNQNKEGFFVKDVWLTKIYIIKGCGNEKINIELFNEYEELVAWMV